MNAPVKRPRTQKKIERHSADGGTDSLADRAPKSDDFASARREIAALRKEVAALRERLSEIRMQTDDISSQAAERPWLRIAGTVAATFLLGKLAQRLRLGAAGAAAVPLIVAQANGRIW